MTDNDDKTVVLSAADLQKETASNPVSSAKAPRATLVCNDTTQIDGAEPPFIIELSDSEQSVGRGDVCTTPVACRKLSRKHARIFPGVGQWGIEDLNSTNGVYVNGTRTTTAWLKHGDEISFGPVHFEFKLERPELADTTGTDTSANTADKAEAAAAEEEDDSEKTMMFGSLNSSEAFLAAAEEARKQSAEPEPEPEKLVPQPAAAPATGTKKININYLRSQVTPKNIGIGAAVFLIVILALWYPSHRRAAEIEQSLKRTAKTVNRVVEASRTQTTAHFYKTSFENELNRLAEMKEIINHLSETNPENLQLAEANARLGMLIFEREFAKTINKKDLSQAKSLVRHTVAKAGEIIDGLPTDAPERKVRMARTYEALARSGNILVTFKEFARKYPTVDEEFPPEKSTLNIDELDGLKRSYNDYRRTYNQQLAVDFRIFQGIMDDIERNDISIFNEWINYYSNRAINF